VNVIVPMAEAVGQRRNDYAKHENHEPCQTLAGASAAMKRQRAQLGLPAWRNTTVPCCADRGKARFCVSSWHQRHL
jgi:hypothetical protein